MGKLEDEIKDMLQLVEKMKEDYPTMKKAYKKAKEWANGIEPSIGITRSFFIDMVKDFSKKWLSE